MISGAPTVNCVQYFKSLFRNLQTPELKPLKNQAEHTAADPLMKAKWFSQHAQSLFFILPLQAEWERAREREGEVQAYHFSHGLRGTGSVLKREDVDALSPGGERRPPGGETDDRRGTGGEQGFASMNTGYKIGNGAVSATCKVHLQTGTKARHKA